MGWFNNDNNERAYEQVYQGQGEQHQAKWSHELIGGAAAFEAMKAYENHEEREGKVENHKFAKELLAGFAGAEVDKLFETKGLNEIDRERAKHHAQQQAQQGYQQFRQEGY